MKAKKSLLFFLLVLLLGMNAKAQCNFDLVDRYDLDTSSVFARIRQDLSNKGFDDNHNIVLYPIYLFVSKNRFTSDDYLSCRFLSNLKPTSTYFPVADWNRKKKFCFRKSLNNEIEYDTIHSMLLLEEIMIGDSLSNFGGWADPYGNFLYIADPKNYHPSYHFSYSPILELLNTKELDAIFRVYFGKVVRTNKDHYYMGISYEKHQVYCVITTQFGIELFLLEDIVNNHWEDFQNGLPELYEEVSKRKEAEHEKK